MKKSELETQNEAFLAYAKGGKKPVYKWVKAPNVPDYPPTHEELHQREIETAIQREIESLRNIHGKALSTYEKDDLISVKAKVFEGIQMAIANGQDVTRVSDYPKFAAYHRLEKEDK